MLRELSLHCFWQSPRMLNLRALQVLWHDNGLIGRSGSSSQDLVQNQQTAFVYESTSSDNGRLLHPQPEFLAHTRSPRRPPDSRHRCSAISYCGSMKHLESISSSKLVVFPNPSTFRAGRRCWKRKAPEWRQMLEGSTVERLPVMQKFVHRVLLYMPDTNNINGAHALGQRQRAIGYSMDGVSGKEPAVGQVNDYQRTMVASLDSIQEFKMWTNGTPAEFGHSSGGLLSVVFKSGANSFHGTAEDRYTSGKLRHRHYLEQSRITSPFDYHEWGGTASGPIIKDKTFWFFGFQQHYEKLAETVTTTVPSPEMLAETSTSAGGAADLRSQHTAQGRQRQLDSRPIPRQPHSGKPVRSGRQQSAGSETMGASERPGDITPNGPNNNLEGDFPGLYKFERYDFKIDHQFSTNHKIFGRYSRVRHRSEERPVRGLTDPLQFGNVYVRPLDFHNMVVSDTYTFSPSMINEVRAGFNRRAFTAVPPTFDQDWAQQLGIPNVSSATFPDFLNSGGARFYGFGPGGAHTPARKTSPSRKTSRRFSAAIRSRWATS